MSWSKVQSFLPLRYYKMYQMIQPQKLQFTDIFFKSIIKIVFDPDHRVKFSKSGATCFMKEIIFLIHFFESYLGHELDLDSVHLLRNFVYFIQQESGKEEVRKSCLTTTSQITIRYQSCLRSKRPLCSRLYLFLISFRMK